MELRDILVLIGGFIIISGILALLLRAVLSGQSNMAIERLKRINQQNLQQELELKKKLEDAETQYQRKLAEAEEEVKKNREKMEQEISELKNKIVASAEREKSDILSDAQQEIEDLKTELIASINSRALNFTEQVITKLFSVSADNENMIKGIHSCFVDEAIKKMKSLDRGIIISSMGNANEIEVLSALAITDIQKRAISETFYEITKKNIKIIERPLQPKYLAGISIKIGDLIIDASLNNIIKQILSDIKSASSESLISPKQ